AMETASAAQEAPLSVIISTQAPTDADLLSVLIDDALTKADPKVKCVLHTAPKEDDPFIVETIKKANPHFNVFMNTEEVVRQANEAKRMPSREASYRNLILNQRVEARNPFVSHQVWLDNGRTQIGHLEGAQVYGGLDLSATNDLTALLLAVRQADEFDIHPTFWLPENNLHEKAKSDRVPYDVWAREGFLETTPGSAIEYEWVAQYLRDLFDSCDVQGIAFDRYNMRFLKPWLE
ncbi:MAG: terminase, partial [Aestuariibacter sp.]|nr:terminase [Aestuariibacter sp.]